jgi:Xaa-Pro aminopeptidase
VKLGPISLMKAVKNEVEVEGMRQALIRDSATVAKYLRWVELAINNNEVVSELSGSEKLLKFRRYLV